eukprot:TRINITY_DN16362_c0_g1_i3.p1 TRINITY_DN16362_c0_g1~~TRINITY_DN16362_c0_g1_i3.p1  ORF type:complete len:206 (+),score=35.85 TRINITY_DN16362_c0_g1_i3:49-666(+)
MAFFQLCSLMLLFQVSGCFSQNPMLDRAQVKSQVKILSVGKEVRKEILPLETGEIMYQISGLKESTWYEVKISYPASIPASFSIVILKDASAQTLKLGRRLLNVEKLIFNSNDFLLVAEDAGLQKVFASVRVKPAGVVAKANLKEREFVIYNIVCDELIYGLPNHVWWVGFLVLLCITVSLFIPLLCRSHFFAEENGIEYTKRVD